MIRPGDVVPTGWFWDGEQQVFHDSTGNFYIAGQWYARPDLLAAQPFPAPPTASDKARMEVQRLRTGWPTYGEAWKEAKALKLWSRRWAIFGIFMVLPLISLFATIADSGIAEDDTIGGSPLNMQGWMIPILLAALSIPFAWWKVYHSACKRRDPHKAAAFAIASYGVVAAGAHAARRHGERHPSATINPPGWTPEGGYDTQRPRT